MKFRVLKSGDKFILQKKFLWFWITETEEVCYEVGYISIVPVKFFCVADAENYAKRNWGYYKTLGPQIAPSVPVLVKEFKL